MFKVNSERQLSDLLKLISEEAVKYTKKQLKEGDPFDNYYAGLKDEEKSIYEQEDAAAQDNVDSTDNTSRESEPEIAQPTEEEQETQDTKPSDAGFVASKDRLVDFVNDIRSAPSLKDSAVDEQVSSYYDGLSQEERDVLVFFLRELSRVMTGKASGTEARDPSDPPLNISFISKEKESSAASGGVKSNQPPAAPSPESQTSRATPGDQEDTTPPIKVNESQDHRIIRQKIRSLFAR